MDHTAKVLLVVGFVGLLLLGVLGAFIGNMRRHGVAGFWLGFLLGPLGVLIAALLPDDRRQSSG